MPDIKQTLSERQKTHGDFRHNGRVSQNIKQAMRENQWWGTLAQHQREALDMIAHKISRILSGTPNFADHWIDIAGYATLVSMEIANHGRNDPYAELREANAKGKPHEPVPQATTNKKTAKTRSRTHSIRL